MTNAWTIALLCMELGFAQNAENESKEIGLKELGLEYRQIVLEAPRPNRVNVLRVDLSRDRLEPVVVLAPDPDGDGPADAALTDPMRLAKHESVVAFVNTNPWDSFPDENGKRNRRWHAGQRVDIHSLAASKGRVRSPANADEASIWIDKDGRVHTGKAPPPKSIVQGIAGFSPIVRDGKTVASPGGAKHPRTAIGIDRKGRILWLVVVDGRQKGFSEGMTLHELGEQMRQLGCWRAVNMDGGGSSVMGLAALGKPLKVINSPSGRRLGKRVVRPLPAILTIRKKPAASDKSDKDDREAK